MLKVVDEESESNATGATAGSSLLDEIVRDGAGQMLAGGVCGPRWPPTSRAHADQVDEDGRRLVVRNGFHAEREVTTAAGVVPVRQPRVNDKRIDPASGERQRFASAILPSVGAEVPAGGRGAAADGPARPVQRLRPGVGAVPGLGRGPIGGDLHPAHHAVLEQDKVCLLVMIGVRADGKEELIALADGFKESGESWADLLRDCRRCGMRAPVLAVGDGALGFCGA